MSAILTFMMMGASGAAASEAPTEPLFVVPVEPILQDEVEDHDWHGLFALTAMTTDGNTEITNIGITADAAKEGDRDRTSVGAYWNYNEDEDVITQRRIGGYGQYDYFATDRLYYYGRITAENDKQSELDLRFTSGAGLGYQVRDDEEWKIGTEAGLTWYYEDFARRESDDYLAARLAYSVDWLAGENWSWSNRAEIFPSLEDKDDVYSKMDTRVRVDLTENMFAQTQWVWDWDNTPAPGNERSDHRVFMQLGWNF